MWEHKEQPWHLPDHDEEVVYAVRALGQGVANAEQQQVFWRYLMYVTAASEEFADVSYRPDAMGGERNTVFAEGKRFVGLMFRRLLNPKFTPKPETPSIPDTARERLRQRRLGTS
jgi:hypothetical protein